MGKRIELDNNGVIVVNININKKYAEIAKYIDTFFNNAEKVNLKNAASKNEFFLIFCFIFLPIKFVSNKLLLNYINLYYIWKMEKIFINKKRNQVASSLISKFYL